MKKNKETKLLRLYRKMHKHYTKNHFKRSRFYQKLIRLLFSCEMPSSVVIGSGTEIVHGGLGCVFHKDVVIGDDCKIFQNVTIGGLPDSNGVPRIGNKVLIGSGAVILGDVVIGDNAKIGANAVVIENVPANCTAVGIPARIINKN